GAGAQVAHAHGAGGLRLRRPALHLDQAHAAIAGNRQPLVEAEARHFRPRLLRRLQQRVVVGYFDLFPVDLDLSHQMPPAVFAASYAFSQSSSAMPLTIMPSACFASISSQRDLTASRPPSLPRCS